MFLIGFENICDLRVEINTFNAIAELFVLGKTAWAWFEQCAKLFLYDLRLCDI